MLVVNKKYHAEFLGTKSWFYENEAAIIHNHFISETTLKSDLVCSVVLFSVF